MTRAATTIRRSRQHQVTAAQDPEPANIETEVLPMNPAAEADRPERRAIPRHVCALDGDCQPITALEAGNHWPARAADVSAAGVALILSRRFEPGTLLAIELEVPGADTAYMPLACVRYVQPLGQHYQLGCVWSKPLSPEEVRNLVGKAA